MKNRTKIFLYGRKPAAIFSGRTRPSPRRNPTGNEVRARPSVGCPRMTTGSVRLDTLVVNEDGTVRRPTVTFWIDESTRFIAGYDVN